MSIISRSRIFFQLRNHNPRLFCSNNNPTEPISASVLANEATSSSPPPPPPEKAAPVVNNHASVSSSPQKNAEAATKSIQATSSPPPPSPENANVSVSSSPPKNAETATKSIQATPPPPPEKAAPVASILGNQAASSQPPPKKPAAEKSIQATSSAPAPENNHLSVSSSPLKNCERVFGEGLNPTKNAEAAKSIQATSPAPAPQNAAPVASILGNHAASSKSPPKKPGADTPIFSPWVLNSLPRNENATAGNIGGKSLRFLKNAMFAALTGCVATAGYVTYAYTLEEVNDKTKAFRASAKVPVDYDFSSFEKVQAMLKSAAMTVPAKSIELYLGLRAFYEQPSKSLLPDLGPLEQEMRLLTLVLDLEETLVYTDFKRERGWRTFKRPGVDEFLLQLSQFYEIVVYTARSSIDADRFLDSLDQKGCISHRLSLNATIRHDGMQYRDLSRLNRDPSRIFYVSGNALKNCLQSENCVAIKPWKGEAEDTQLLDLIPFFEYVARKRPADIRHVLASYQGHEISKEFNERSKQLLRFKQEQKQHRFWRF